MGLFTKKEKKKTHRAVAQPGSASDWGSEGRGFESLRPDQIREGLRTKPESFFFYEVTAESPPDGALSWPPMSANNLPLPQLAHLLRQATKALREAPQVMPTNWGEPPPELRGDAGYERQEHRRTRRRAP